MTEHGWVYQDKGTVVYRASSLGSCIRSLVAARLGESAAGPNAGLRAAMDASSGLEDECIRRFGIEMASSDVIWQQKEVELSVCNHPDGEPNVPNAVVIVRGHIDGMSMYDDTILEVKALGEGNWAKWIDGKNVHESLANLGTLGDKYRIQAALYGHATERRVRFVIGPCIHQPMPPPSASRVRPRPRERTQASFLSAGTSERLSDQPARRSGPPSGR